MRHSVVVSDVHLCEAVPGDGLWLRYRQKRFFPDGDFSKLFDWLREATKGEGLELIFNGDLFDFDAPSVIDGEVRHEDQPRDERTSVATLTRILDDHAEFVAALGRLLASGRLIVFVSGNHDAQLVFPGVQKLLETRLIQAAQSINPSIPEKELSGRIIFRSWFYTTPDGVHVEHGNQYDRYCSFRYPTEPFTNDGTSIQPTVGSLTFRHMASRMGYFNPHVDSSFMLTLPKYVAHWARYYLFTGRSLFMTGIRGIYATVTTTWRQRTRPDAETESRMITKASQEGADPELVKRHAVQFAAPSEDAFHGLLRELWLDRAVLVGTGTVVALGAYHVGTAVTLAKAALGAGAGITGYEIVVPKPTLGDIYKHIDSRAPVIAGIYGARGVVFGHTHMPSGVWENGVFVGNSGTWSPSFKDIECTFPISTGRPVIWLRSSDDGQLTGGLYQWQDGTLRPSEKSV